MHQKIFFFKTVIYFIKPLIYVLVNIFVLETLLFNVLNRNIEKLVYKRFFCYNLSGLIKYQNL